MEDTVSRRLHDREADEVTLRGLCKSRGVVNRVNGCGLLKEATCVSLGICKSEGGCG